MNLNFMGASELIKIKRNKILAKQKVLRLKNDSKKKGFDLDF